MYVSLHGPNGGEVRYPGYQRAKVVKQDDVWKYNDSFAVAGGLLKVMFPPCEMLGTGSLTWHAGRYGVSFSKDANPVFVSQLIDRISINTGVTPMIMIQVVLFLVLSDVVSTKDEEDEKEDEDEDESSWFDSAHFLHPDIGAAKKPQTDVTLFARVVDRKSELADCVREASEIATKARRPVSFRSRHQQRITVKPDEDWRQAFEIAKHTEQKIILMGVRDAFKRSNKTGEWLAMKNLSLLLTLAMTEYDMSPENIANNVHDILLKDDWESWIPAPEKRGPSRKKPDPLGPMTRVDVYECAADRLRMEVDRVPGANQVQEGEVGAYLRDETAEPTCPTCEREMVKIGTLLRKNR